MDCRSIRAHSGFSTEIQDDDPGRVDQPVSQGRKNGTGSDIEETGRQLHGGIERTQPIETTHRINDQIRVSSGVPGERGRQCLGHCADG
jgi:hypothetical protein